MNIFLAESSIGSHRPCMELFENAILMSFTFRASHTSYYTPITNLCLQTYIRVANKRAFNVAGMDNAKEVLEEEFNDEIIRMIQSMHKKGGEGYIYLGFDDDVGGQTMASLLYYHLLNIGVDKKYIITVPLTEVGYDYILFDLAPVTYSEEQLIVMMEASRFEQIMMNTGRKTGIGYRNMQALEHISDRNNELQPKVTTKSKGTSNATYFSKFALGETETIMQNKKNNNTGNM